ncbi:hypothetical protein NONO_c24680 [Nocardia nova SH22a]|uniref:Uncharacterized protein n=1 Tax=Nocardia nova SH22a TaxID=1415166 RepID=W5TDL5_9NOCA|nr:hypothetical protein [Nocardia nova]AHH17264.1 hypothetical protein NONO_c24680 [Nocardia nova SH22a]
MNSRVRIRLIGPEEAVAVVAEDLQLSYRTLDAQCVIDGRRYRSRRDPGSVRAYGHIWLPSYLFDGSLNAEQEGLS